MPFTMVQSAFDGFFPHGQLQGYWKSLYLSEFSDEAIDLIAQKAQERPSPLTLLDVYIMGGAGVASEDTAFSERSAPYMVAVLGNWNDAGDNAENIAWVRQTWSEIGAFGTGSTYLNFTGRAEVKATYDPDNFFRVNNNIVPVTQSHPARRV